MGNKVSFSIEKTKRLADSFLSQFPVENVRRQYAANAAQLKRMAEKALDKKKKYNGKTAIELFCMADNFFQKSISYGD